MLANTRKSTPLYKKIFTIFISILLTAFQVAIFYFTIFGAQYFAVVYLLVEIAGAVAVFAVYRSSMNANYKLIWTILILLVPTVGLVLYLLVKASHSLPNRKNKKIYSYMYNKIPINTDLEFLKTYDAGAYKLAQNINYSTSFPIYKGNEISYYSDIRLKHKHMIEAIAKAKKFVFLEYFIIADGLILEELIRVLEVKGSEGIEIKFIYDDIGSKTRINHRTLARIRSIPNLILTAYEPLGFNVNPTINYRDHRKMAIIDGKTAFIGGDNLADEYAHIVNKYGYWRDNAIEINGSSVDSLTLLFATMWYMSTKETLDINEYKVTHTPKETNNFIMPFGDGPTNTCNPAYDLFKGLINSAKTSLLISTPYFIIDDEMIDTIIAACRSGVNVKILVPHIPDKKTVFMITQAHYKRILEAGGEIYEYTKGFNHAKNIIVDETYAFIGTVNMDYRSLFLHYECGAYIYNDPCIKNMRLDFLTSLESSENISLERFKKRSIISKVIGNILAIFSPLC